MPATAVIFDVDGTLVDSNDAHAAAWVRAFHDEGIRVDPASVRRSIGMGGDKLMPAVSGIDSDTPVGRRIAARRAEIFQSEYLPALKAFPRAAELVSTLKERGFALAVASSAERKDLDKLLSTTGLTGLIEKRSSGDEVKESKPDPDVVVAALQHLKRRADETVMIGDTPYDVQAAAAAGLQCIALRSGGWNDQDLAGAIALYDDAASLLADLASSPLAVPSGRQFAI